MAEFKLGRIRFVWKGDWAASQTYYIDDVIKFGGRTFICQVGHVSNINFNTDLEFSPAIWNILTDGQEWKGEWSTSTTYEIRDVVKYGGNIYICRVSHVSASTFTLGLEEDQDLPSGINSKWDLHAEGFDWKSNWGASVRYKVGDVVKYGGTTFICNQGHTSAETLLLGLEEDQTKWNDFATGFDFKGNWELNGSLFKYKINDIVKQGAGLWICIDNHASTESFIIDESLYWERFVEGVEFEGEWNNVTVYQPGDVVAYGGNQYIAKTNHADRVPSTGSTDWEIFVKGFKFTSDWSPVNNYRPGEIVRLRGFTYLATVDNLNQEPPNISFWQRLNAGIAWQGEWGSYDVIDTQTFTVISVPNPDTEVGGAVYQINGEIRPELEFQRGGVYTFDQSDASNVTHQIAFKDGAGDSYTVGVVTAGPVGTTGAQTVITVAADAPDDLRYYCVTHGNGMGNIITVIGSGVSYKLGDAVRFGSNAYICVAAHTASAGVNDPASDPAGTFWNLLNIGSETSVLTTQGDLVFFGGVGPTRLPIGKEGQVLRAGSEIPEWVTLGEVDQVFFVAETGIDLPAPTHGKTLHKPFRSIRYACDQIENGVLFPNSRHLLELNRVFIQREVTKWIQFQISENIAPFTTSFVYDDFKCERDVGFIIDRLIHDLGRGGNLKIRTAAQRLLNVLDDGPFLTDQDNTGPYDNLALEADKSVAAYGYMLELVNLVVNNQEPISNYQTITGDNSSAIVNQYIDFAYEPESAADRINELIEIVITALETQDPATIPARFLPTTLVQVATGKYRETFPIIVPANTCVKGDELRSTNTGPAESLIDISDSFYTLTTFEHVKDVVAEVVLGNEIIATPGNTTIQSQEWPYADLTEAASIRALVEVMQNQSDYKLGTMHTSRLPEPAGYNVSFLTGYGNARKLIKENKKFLQEEVLDYLKNNYSEISFTGSISGTTLTVTSITEGTLYSNLLLISSFIIDGTTIVSQLTGSPGKVGTYTVTESQEVQPIQIRGDTRYGKTKTKRDIGYIIDALVYDLTYNGNAQSVQAGLAYWDGDDVSAPQIPASIKTATTDSLGFLKARLMSISTNTLVAPLQTRVAQFRATAGSTEARDLIENNVDIVIEIINNGPIDATYTLIDPTPADGVNTTAALIAAYADLSTNITNIQNSTITWINDNYPDLEYSSAKYSRDIGIILKAVGFDFMFNSNYQTIKAAHAYLRNTDYYVDYVLEQKEVIRTAINYALNTLAVANVNSEATAITRINSSANTIDQIIFGASNEGRVLQTEFRNVDYAILQLERNRNFIVSEIEAYIVDQYNGVATATSATDNLITISDTSWLKRNTAIKFTGVEFGNIEVGTTYFVQDIISTTTFKISAERHSNTSIILDNGIGSLAVELVYNKETYLQDIETYIDALKWDLKFASNYKSRFVARYYTNAVLGSLEEDMYYLRDSTGIRDQTIQGLSGDLTPRNTFGTSRVTAGACVSLDPGWGPDDSRTWILTRSPYVQNVTTIGHAAIGQKIDGALHNGGNDSIVSNDFTQVISHGIGAWIANNGRAELVSVFSYYAHIAYLATEGGRIRATNGNNSYGDFGSVAEGFDSREIPGTAAVDNIFQFTATIGSVFTNGSAMLNFEFENAGVDYTEVQYNLLGGGISANVEADEFRDNGVFQVRLLENAPEGSDGEFGGSNFLTTASTAQGGTVSTLTLAAVDDESSTAYPGMRIYLTGGAAAGQTGIINTYNNGTKVATILKELDDVTAGTFVNGIQYRIITVGTTDYTLIGAINNNPGTIFTASGAGAGSGVALELVSGWDHIVPGTTIASPDASSTYIIEPALTFSSPEYFSTTFAGPAEAAYGSLSYAEQFQTYIAVIGTTNSNGIDAEFNVIKKGLKYIVFKSGNGTGYERLDTITIVGSLLGGTDTINDIVITVTSVDSLSGEVLDFDFTGTGNGGNFISLLSTNSDQATLFSNSVWSEVSLPSVDAWKATASGRLQTSIAAGSLIAGESYVIETLEDTVWTAIGARNNFIGEIFVAEGPTSGSGLATPLKTVTVAVAHAGGTNTSAYSEDGGLTWTAGGTLPIADWTDIAYGAGVWVAIATGSNLTAYSDDGGITWIAGGNLPVNTTWTSIAYGAGKFVAVAGSGTAAAYSTNEGLLWTAGTLPSSTDWSSVAFGNNRYVAVSSGDTTAAYSLDGISWTASETPGGFTAITYGQGTFFAVGATTTAASSPDGVVWRSRTINNVSSAGVAFGNPSRLARIFTISSTGTSNVSDVQVGARAKARAAVADTKIFEIRLLEPGSRYLLPPALIVSDPNRVFNAPFTVRIGLGVLANPSFVNRGLQFVTGNAEVRDGDGFANNFQAGAFVAVRRISKRPTPGSNVVFDHLPMRTFKLVNVFTFLGDFDGSFTAFYQVSPPLVTNESPNHLENTTTRLLYSQVRLTGHDFLDIGTGNFEETNYPGGIPEYEPNPKKETTENNGGRVFFTSTDQDGNFRVGDLFAIEQSTGIATLNADAFNISGLQELNLGNVTLGGGSATITEFSTDPFFTADSDNVIPTQRAIKAFIAGQIGGGGASLNVNSITAGAIFISGTSITTVTGAPIRIDATLNFTAGITGIPLALNYFL